MSNVITIPINNFIDTDKEIILESAFKENAVPRTRLIELSQVSLLKSYSVHFTLYDGHFVSVYSKTIFSKPKKYWINIAYLEPVPRRILKIDRPALYITGTLLLVSVILILINTFSNGDLMLPTVTIATVCGALISFLLLIYRSRDRVVFYTRYGRITWLEFLINKPTRRTYKEFIEILNSDCHAVSNHQSHRHEQRLGTELREHRRLKDEGILSSRIYEDVKRRFLGRHAGLKDMYVEDSDIRDDKVTINSSNIKILSKAALEFLVNRISTLREKIKKPVLQADKSR